MYRLHIDNTGPCYIDVSASILSAHLLSRLITTDIPSIQALKWRRVSSLILLMSFHGFQGLSHGGMSSSIPSTRQSVGSEHPTDQCWGAITLPHFMYLSSHTALVTHLH